ncbi:PREDICTED: hemicentin-1-like isoform X2 [Polistes dominula]|uniref:Hemicentin-1-like isoform X2 n=1 Tax=Polistes dominula TaxID=743375 RepID=A0ABM1JH60_POLDO|nr:PREDICTED: hemicentin-1-like isoform X2 [Polistes dominula]
MRCPSLAVFVAVLTTIRAQGVPRTFSTRPYRGGPAIPVRAVLRGTAELPCDIRPPRHNDSTVSGHDSAILVVWYKNDMTPIYSYDMRGKHLEKHWKNKEHLNEFTHFRMNTDPAMLIINSVEEKDEGDYRCRVDFNKSPTRNSRIYLTIIVPPRTPNIIDERGNPVLKVTGPYEEGGNMKLTCLVTGGRPEPTVKWWRGETLLDSKDMRGEFPDLRRNTLVVTDLSRADLHAVFTCQASNNNISQPESVSVAIEMHLRPLSVNILSNEQTTISADRKYNISCITVGSRPPAKLYWYLDGQKMDNYTEKVSADGNMTSSVFTFKPTLFDHNKVLTCRAENNKVSGGYAEDTLKLNIYFVPILKLGLGSNMNPDDIEEGDDVYFECKVRANPWAYKVVWKHNGNVIQNNAKNGVIVQQYDLALRKVNRSQAGNYTCVASNVEGDGYSNSVELKIMYKPICVSEQKNIYGVARHEIARVVCTVEAYPPPESFRWAFNTSQEMVDMPQARFKNSTQHSQSILVYRPVTDMDYGSVSCWASNAAGQQKNACIFYIIPAGKPEIPYNCTLTNQTTQSLSVECTAGFDGGQTQYFVLEVFDEETGILQANLTREIPQFTVQNLESGKVLTMILFAVNGKGQSEKVVLEGFTLKVAEKQTGTQVPFEITPLLLGLIGVFAALVLVTGIIFAALKLRSDRRAQRPGDLPLKKATAPSSEDLYDADDRNPDVVPSNKDSDYQLTGSTSGTPLATQNTPDGLPPSSLPSTQQNNHLQGLTAYNEYNNYPTLPLSGEVTYAELCLTRPTTLSTLGTDTKLANLGTVTGLGGLQGYGSGVIVGGKSYAKEATVYACIDHTARPPKIDTVKSTSSCGSTPLSTMSGLLHESTVTGITGVTGLTGVTTNKHHPAREVVTVRTPLISSQESCV